MTHDRDFLAPRAASGGLACILFTAALSTFALADADKPGPVDVRMRQLDTNIPKVVVSHGEDHGDRNRTRVRGVIQNAGGTAGTSDCTGTMTATHTDNNFSGGVFVVQAGFAEGEIAAASYVLDPSEFPITIESLECIFAAPRVSSPTVTKYSVIIWDGTPDLGDVVALFQSDDEFIPHLRMEQSNNAVGVNVKIVIDPSDPEQVILTNANGTNTFSIGYRIDEHNAQTADPCLLGPPVDLNAFPTTDSALATSTDNWIRAIDCGFFGCPSGWRRFSQLGLCRPRGDWIMRAVYRCEPAIQVGACCFTDVTCEDFFTITNCEDQGGTFMGTDSRCGTFSCPEPLGACCLSTTCLTNVERPTCSAVEGIFIGPNTFCTSQPCRLGVCCMPDGSCVENIQLTCVGQGGVFHVNRICATFGCPQPTGACCIGEVCVAGQTQATCENVGTWNGADSVCGPLSCVPEVCPVGLITLSNPPSGVVDARQPHPSNLATIGAMQGIGSANEPIILTLGSTSAPSECFSLCETEFDVALGPNGIAEITEGPPGVYSLVLLRPITPGAVTMIGYRSSSFVTYTSHPGNINADPTVNPNDTFNLVQYLFGTFSSPHGSFSFDLDHSGQVNAQDLVRSVDLYNGADLYNAWSNTVKPTDTGCP
ncbi:MAG: hypothetical protein AABZ47_14520 [Planctomycetota bacterium]